MVEESVHSARVLQALVEELLRSRRIDGDAFARLLPEGLSPADLAERLAVIRSTLSRAPALSDPPVPDAENSPPARTTDVELGDPADWDTSGNPDESLVASELPVSTRYEGAERIGRGAVGEVISARDRLLRREVALKVLLADSQRSPEARLRFLQEAKTTARLAHPGIIPVHDLGILPDGRWFYAMRRIAGRTLHDVLHERREPLPRLLTLFARICQTVAYAHDNGVLHRDLKPDNILVGDYGEVYVADWGLAKRFGDPTFSVDKPSPDITMPGIVIGTVLYMSPEQLQGRNEELTAASDVWSLGVILFELLTRRHPFNADSVMGLAIKVVSAPIPDPRELAPPDRQVPEEMATLCREAMTRNARQRSLTARILAERVLSFLDGEEAAGQRRERSQALMARARDEFTEWTFRRQEIADDLRLLRGLRDALRPSTPRKHREEIWALERAIVDKRLDADSQYARIAQFGSQSVEEWDTREGHDFLADLYWQQVTDAAQSADGAREVYFRALAERHDRGILAGRLVSTGDLTIGVDAPTARVALQAVHAFGPVLRADGLPVVGDLRVLPAGLYLACVEAVGRVPAQVPVQVAAGAVVTVALALPTAFPGHEEFAFVPAGAYPIGGDDQAAQSLPEQIVQVESFLMGRFPVTMAGYCVFLNALAATDPKAAQARAPRSTDGTVGYLNFDAAARTFTIPRLDRDGDPWDPQWPVLMINWHDAAAYCTWRSVSEGIAYRLPTEIEWEVAARGVDRRIYPWGNGFDSTLCRMCDSAEGVPAPVTVGTYELDCSPFGVRDMAGLVMEWTSTPADPAATRYIQRGAAYTSPAPWCRAATRRSNLASWNTPQFSFRVVRAITPSV